MKRPAFQTWSQFWRPGAHANRPLQLSVNNRSIAFALAVLSVEPLGKIPFQRRRPMAAWTEASMDNEATRVPPHVEETVAAIAALHAAHYRQAGAQQKFVSAATAAVARPLTLGLVTIAIVGWLVLNIALVASGREALDPFPFPLLSAAVSTVALYLAAMILIAQRHDDALATRRDQLTLELAILGEQKSAKIIALLEE